MYTNCKSKAHVCGWERESLFALFDCASYPWSHFQFTYTCFIFSCPIMLISASISYSDKPDKFLICSRPVCLAFSWLMVRKHNLSTFLTFVLLSAVRVWLIYWFRHCGNTIKFHQHCIRLSCRRSCVPHIDGLDRSSMPSHYYLGQYSKSSRLIKKKKKKLKLESNNTFNENGKFRNTQLSCFSK